MSSMLSVVWSELNCTRQVGVVSDIYRGNVYMRYFSSRRLSSQTYPTRDDCNSYRKSYNVSACQTDAMCGFDATKRKAAVQKSDHRTGV